MTAIIDRAIAKQELARINGVLKEPHLLIGGLAVQQYHVSRNSKDIDLICSFETADEIIEELYPSNKWSVKNKQSDDYRPSYNIICKYEDRGIIIFGPKISERTPYAHLDWDSLRKGATPFVGPDGELQHILVPTAAALAYTKFISFLGRNPSSSDKIKQDLKDFIDLTNEDGFSTSEFISLLQRTKAFDELCQAFQEKSNTYNYRSIVEGSCLHDVATIVYAPTASPNLPSKFSTMKTRAVVYVAAPHKNVQRNKGIKSALDSAGFEVRIPYDEVAKRNMKGTSNTPDGIRSICIDAIDESQFVMVDLDTYGLDTAWELGYAEGLGKRVIGYNQDVFLTTDQRTVNRRPYQENFMHGWQNSMNGRQTQPVFTDLSQLAATCQNKSVYIVGSFSNDAAEEQVGKALEGIAQTVILPKRYIDDQKLLPKDYPLAERGETNQLLEGSDVVLVILPRYGMDSSWQIGYATAKKKIIIGVVLEDDNVTRANQSFWDHWMHGWKNKIRVTGAAELCAVLNGFWHYSS